MKTVDIKGKSYVMVNERITYFRNNLPNYSLVSEIVELNEECCTIIAKVIDDNERIIATGIAKEYKDSTFINKTSYVENCETSAWGRALGNLGIGIDTSIASAEEMENAINNQNKQKSPKNNLKQPTLEEARKRTTLKGKMYSQLSEDNLQFIINSDKVGEYSKACARLVLEDKQNGFEDLHPLEESDLPF